MKKRNNLEPLVRELDLKLADVESGQLCEASRHHVQDSLCRTLRAYLRQKYGLKEESSSVSVYLRGAAS